MPTTTTGIATSFIDFTRASNATVTDSDGKVKWAPHNLLLASESFDAAAWTKAGTSIPTITANAATSPDGKTTADQLALAATSAVNQFSSVSGAAATTANDYTASVWLRTVSGTATVYIQAFGSAYSTAVACSLTTTWQLFSVTFTGAAGTSYFNIGPDARTGSGQPTSQSAATVYAWGAHLYRSDLGGMQPNTSAYPMYNPTTPKNLLGYTEAFGSWTAADVQAFGSGSTSNAAIAPNGLQTADLITETNTTAIHVVYQTVDLTIGGIRYTLSAYFKANTRTSALLRVGGGGTGSDAPAVRFLLTGSGTATTLSTGSTVVSSSITPVADGWYRCSVTFTSGNPTTHAINIGPHDGSASVSYAGDGTSGVYAWGAQLSYSASLDSYVPVYGAAVTSAAYYGPRRDFDGATLACKGLLVEEQRSNITTYSSEFDNAAWGKANLNTTGTPAWVNVQTAPDGMLTADKLIESNTTAQHYVSRAQTVTSGSTYTLSFYLRAGERTWTWLEFYSGIPTGTVYINLSTGDKGTTTGSASAVTVTNVGGNWWRVVLPGFVASSTTPAFAVYTSTGNGVNSYAGDGTSGIYIWGAQLEENASFATSYIPVGATTAGATRLADVASVSTQAFPYSATEGTVVVSGTAANATAALVGSVNPILATLTSLDTGESIFFQRVNGTNGANYLVRASAANQASFTPGTWANGATAKLAGAWAVNNFNGAFNGTVGTVDTTGSLPTPAANLRIGNFGASDGLWNGWIRQITYLPRRISDAELATRST